MPKSIRQKLIAYSTLNPSSRGKIPKPFIVYTYDKDGNFEDLDIYAAANALAIPNEMLRQGKKVTTNKPDPRYPRPLFELTDLTRRSAEDNEIIGVRLRFTNVEHWYYAGEIIEHAYKLIQCLIDHGITEIYCHDLTESQFIWNLIEKAGFADSVNCPHLVIRERIRPSLLKIGNHDYEGPNAYVFVHPTDEKYEPQYPFK